MKILAGFFVALAMCGPAQAAGFEFGIAEPGVGPISSQDVSALSLAAERRTVIWHGETSFNGELTWTPGLRAIVSVWDDDPDNPPTTDEARARYCGFVLSILSRYPQIDAVVIWNEPNLSAFWTAGVEAYADLVAACAPRIHAAGAQVYAPGLSPSTVDGVRDFARAIAARGPHLIDAWDQHEYDTYIGLRAKINAIRAAFGWNIPVFVGESQSALLGWIYCQGASGFLNFKLRDDGGWRPTGLENADGSPKPIYDYVVDTMAQIRAGTYDCSTPPQPPSPVLPPSAPRYGPEATGGFPQRVLA